ncbi:endonuclease G, mitochondrial [Lepeophtheirus salmonis]|uniref:Endonuclease n=1 Tax=Lepeophtheirus salmonis TaxID=72036 RepID=A0A0K2THE4_LEPSM|nr:endonuclease G, mitochondrial-like [Lepeophtheirus salmonis]
MRVMKGWKSLLGGGGGLLGGVIIDRFYLMDSREKTPIPGLPSLASVSAAEPYVESNPTNSLEKVERLIPEVKEGINRVSEIMKYGFPSLDTVRSRRDYVISYDRRNRTPNWVFEHLTPESCRRNESVDRNLCEFKEDPSIHPFFRSQNKDYKYSGFDRGHLAAAGNHRQSQEHCDETFYLSNMSPQVGTGFNRDKWENLEWYVRKLAKRSRNVYICTGPLYLPRLEADGKNYVKYQVIGKNNVAVPTHFFKIVVTESEKDSPLDLESFVLPNERIDDSIPLSHFYVPPDSVERASGLLFFDKLSKTRLRSINGKIL